jgi:hypothetical protein
MKTSLRFLAAAFVLSFAGFVCAGDFVSQVLQTGDMPITITVPGDRFLVIRNFTQQGPLAMGQMRGTVTVTSTFGPTQVMTATIVDPSNTTSLEPINNIVIGGPATVMVKPGDSTCFITYRKGED